MKEQTIRYWILGIGVTAVDRDDALRLVAARVFPGGEMPPVGHVREDVDVTTLDQGHVIPNLAPPNRRGVWFPLGYN